jgi:hypothetical protein
MGGRGAGRQLAPIGRQGNIRASRKMRRTDLRPSLRGRSVMVTKNEQPNSKEAYLFHGNLFLLDLKFETSKTCAKLKIPENRRCTWAENSKQA